MASSYSQHDFEQQGIGGFEKPSDTDPRDQFQHDVDRILHSSAFRALAGKTQVVAVEEFGGYHTRLTHSQKVAQLGRRITQLLHRRHGQGPSVDLVEAACLLHDIGHPPFGHAGEVELSRAYRECANKPEIPVGPIQRDGFQGNAQNLHIATFLASRKTREYRGLHLSRATLDASMKYPWLRGVEDKTYGHKHWGVYQEDRDIFSWITGEFPATAPATSDDLPQRPVEEQIMDWADDVTYACHDVEDFYRAGLIPLHLLLNLEVEDSRRVYQPEPYEAEQFLNYVEKKWGARFDRERALNTLRTVQNLGIPEPYDGTHATKVRATSMTSALIKYFTAGVSLTQIDSTKPPVRYNAKLEIPEGLTHDCDLLKELTWFFVIDRPALASQQFGQRRIIRDLFTWHAEDPTHLLPEDRKEELEKHGSPLRSVCDHIASLTERQAASLYRRMSGADAGSLTDALLRT